MAYWIAFWTALWVGSSRITRWVVDWLCNAAPKTAAQPKKETAAEEPADGTGENDEQSEADPGEQPKAPKKKTAEKAEGSALLRWVGILIAAAVTKGLPYTTGITVTVAAAWLLASLVLGYAAALDAKVPAADDEPSGEASDVQLAEEQSHPSQTMLQHDVALLLDAVYTEGSGVHLAALAGHLHRTPFMGHPAAPWETRDVRALLTRHGVRVRPGVRVPPVGGREGVHRDDFPPLPPPPSDDPVVGDVAPGQCNNNNRNTWVYAANGGQLSGTYED